MHTDQWVRGRKGVFGAPGCVFGEWFMGWLGEEQGERGDQDDYREP